MLRSAEERDVDSMRAWRNQPANREVSIHEHEIGADEHAAWWARVQDDPTRRVLVFEHGDQPLGVVSFFDLELDATPRTGAWGFYLDHDGLAAAGTALTAWMKVMGEATAYAFAPEPDGLGLDVLTGEVLDGNDAVRTMNRRFRFTEGPPEQREVDGRTLTVFPIALRREDARRPRTRQRTAEEAQ